MRLKSIKKQFLAAGFFVMLAAFSGISVAALTIRNAESKEQTIQTVNVALNEQSLSPDTVTLRVGQQLSISNLSSESRELSLGSGHGPEAHEESSDDADHEHHHDSSFSTGRIGIDEAWVGNFNEPGTYFFHDHEHPEINLMVVVY